MNEELNPAGGAPLGGVNTPLGGVKTPLGGVKTPSSPAQRNRAFGFSEKSIHFKPTVNVRLHDPRNKTENYQNINSVALKNRFTPAPVLRGNHPFTQYSRGQNLFLTSEETGQIKNAIRAGVNLAPKELFYHTRSQHPEFRKLVQQIRQQLYQGYYDELLSHLDDDLAEYKALNPDHGEHELGNHILATYRDEADKYAKLNLDRALQMAIKGTQWEYGMNMAHRVGRSVEEFVSSFNSGGAGGQGAAAGGKGSRQNASASLRQGGGKRFKRKSCKKGRKSRHRSHMYSRKRC
jgi:hypothetical protein